jgi:predicted DNA-binding protein (MmcQ/YjbR family)
MTKRFEPSDGWWIMAKIEYSATPWSDDSMKDYQWLDELLLEQPATKKEFQPAWQAHKYLLRDKMYAYIGIDDRNRRPIITLKLDPLYSEMLRHEYQDIVPGYYMNKLHWSTVYLDADVPREMLVDMVRASHETVLSSLSKKAQQEIAEG